MRVRAHLHLPRLKAQAQDCISIKPVKVSARTHYAGTILLRNVKFVVQPAGNKKVQETGVRNVHAFVDGEIVEDHAEQIPPRKEILRWRRAYYNPTRVNTFVDKDTFQPIFQAQAVYMVGPKVYYLPKEK